MRPRVDYQSLLEWMSTGGRRRVWRISLRPLNGRLGRGVHAMQRLMPGDSTTAPGWPEEDKRTTRSECSLRAPSAWGRRCSPGCRQWEVTSEAPGEL